MKRWKNQTEGMNKSFQKENLSASAAISTVLTNSLTTDKLTSQVSATIDYRKKKSEKPPKHLPS